MVASLIASGASAGAVTDPSAQDPIGKTAASIAASSGHKGLAGYLSEVALTSHLSSLTMEETELSKCSAELQADITVTNVSKENVASSVDQASLKDTLAAVRNVTLAAARIQAAFRSHSFRRRRSREADDGINGDSISASSIGNMPELSAMSKLSFRNPREHNSAALSIQKKYRGWKGRKDFLALRQKVVKIQVIDVLCNYYYILLLDKLNSESSIDIHHVMHMHTWNRNNNLILNLSHSIFIWTGSCEGLPGSEAIQANDMGSWNLGQGRAKMA